MENPISAQHKKLTMKDTKTNHQRLPFEERPLFVKAGLHYYTKYENVRKQPFYQRLVVCELLKTRGNNFFNQNNIPAAICEYEQALSIFKYILNKNSSKRTEGIKDDDLQYIEYQGDSKDEKAQTIKIKVALYNNLAACYLKLNDFTNTRAACDEALTLDPKQPKALYRRAKALSSVAEWDIDGFKAALEDLKKACELSPTDCSIQLAISTIKQEMFKRRKRKDLFDGIFLREEDFDR